ncbi:MAG TPA: MFS transporter [Phycisphaerae bacterium]|nr:MFS transporter [Phycisphaerae bacterium]
MQQTVFPQKAPKLTLVQWTICAVAAIGFAFDIYELLMMPLIMRDAIGKLGGFKPGLPEFNHWVGMLFWVPAMCGGFFGLIGGYLTDRWGRRRVLVWSILLYAVSALTAGYSNSLTMLLVLRCTTFIGVCVEFVAAVAWLAELFPNPLQRERVLGYTQAFSSIGGIMVAGANWLAVHWSKSLPAIHGGHDAWRYTLISGLIPAIPLIVLRPFLPESPVWQTKKEVGALKRPSIGELFRPGLARVTIVTTIMFACTYGAAFGAIQQLPQIVPGLPTVRDLPKDLQQKTVTSVQSWQEMGGLLGRCILAYLAVRIVSRQKLIRLFQIPGLIIVPLVFLFPARSNLELLKWGVFVAGLVTVAQMSFWGNYLPRIFPMHLRGTGEGFAANVGGRMIGTSAAFVTTQLVGFMPKTSGPAEKYAFAAAIVGCSVYLMGLIASFFLPEPRGEALPE